MVGLNNHPTVERVNGRDEWYFVRAVRWIDRLTAKQKRDFMLNVEISNREIAAPGLYIMRWQKHTGLARIVGEPKKGFKIIHPEGTPETYMQNLPKDGEIPPDALFSEPLAIVAV